MERFASGEIIDVTLIYTQFKSAISCAPDDVTLLPIVTDDYIKSSANLKEEYIYEPDVVTILNDFLPQRIATRIYGAMLHSAASELSSRTRKNSSGVSICFITKFVRRASPTKLTKLSAAQMLWSRLLGWQVIRLLGRGKFL